MPPITASWYFSFATSREVRSNRFITLMLRAGGLVAMFMRFHSLLEDFAAGQKRRQDQRHRSLRGDGLFDRSIDDELEFVEPRGSVVLHRQRIEQRPHGAAHQRLPIIEFA